MLASQDSQAGRVPQDYLAHQDQLDLQETEASLEKMVQWAPGALLGPREPLALRASQDRVGSQENPETTADQAHLD